MVPFSTRIDFPISRGLCMDATVRGLTVRDLPVPTLAGLFVLGCVLVIAGGCGSGVRAIDGSVPVSGTVTFNGQPLEQGMVRFAPEGGGKTQPATGQIKNGKFTMQTTASSPGVVAGKYKVSIISNKPFSPPALKPGTPPDPKAKFEPESLIPKKYNDIKTSGLEADVTAAVTSLTFALQGE
jgi:hypothetical protein